MPAVILSLYLILEEMYKLKLKGYLVKGLIQIGKGLFKFFFKP